ncbi:MAG: hypothetical protein AAGA93_13060 [Actinomycetota bacterium]
MDRHPPPTHPPKKALSERHALLREMIVEASLELLAREGLGLGVDAIGYARVFQDLETEHDVRVTRGSVHRRIWDSHDDYRNDVLVAVAERSSPHHNAPRLEAAVNGILLHLDGLDLDHDERVRTFCRIAGSALLDHYLDSPRFRRFQALKAVARSGGEPTAMLQAMIGEKADGNLAERIDASAFMFRALGLRPRVDLRLTERQAVGAYLALVQTLLTGAHLDHHAGYTAVSAPVETGLYADDGIPWTCFGLGLLATMNLLFERDPSAPALQLDDPAELTARADQLDAEASKRHGSSDQVPGTGGLRRSKDELRALLVSTGERLLLQDGIALTPYSLTYAGVFEYIKATRGVTLHRSAIHKHIWSSQGEFQADVLAEAARYDPGESLVSARQAMAAQVAVRNPDGTVNQRQMILDSTLAIVEAQMHVSAHSSSFHRWQSIKASMLSQDAGDHAVELARAISDRYEELVSDFVETYRSVLPLVGLQVNPDLKIDEDQAYQQFAVLGAAFTSGADYNATAGSGLATGTVPLPRVDGSGRSDSWPIQAMASLAILDLFFVPS